MMVHFTAQVAYPMSNTPDRGPLEVGVLLLGGMYCCVVWPVWITWMRTNASQAFLVPLRVSKALPSLRIPHASAELRITYTFRRP